MKNILISLLNFFARDRVFCYDIKVLQISRVRGCSYGGELVRLSGLARLGEMILSHVHMESSVSVKSKSLLCRWKKIV